MKNRLKVNLYADGASRGNPGHGGYGTILEYTDPKGELHVREFSQGYKLTTNNRMEQMAVITGLEALTQPCEVVVCTDSKYVAEPFNKNWMDTWIKTGWKKGTIKNTDLWDRMLSAMDPHIVTFTWVKGHNNHPQNERCDKLATTAADGVDLIDDTGYNGK